MNDRLKRFAGLIRVVMSSVDPYFMKLSYRYEGFNGLLIDASKGIDLKVVNERHLLVAQIDQHTLGVDAVYLAWLEALDFNKDTVQVRQALECAFWALVPMLAGPDVTDRSIERVRHNICARGLGVWPDNRPTAQSLPGFEIFRATRARPVPELIYTPAMRKRDEDLERARNDYLLISNILDL